MSRGGLMLRSVGYAPGTRLRAGPRSYLAGRPPTEAASSVEPILNRPLTRSLADNPAASDGRAAPVLHKAALACRLCYGSACTRQPSQVSWRALMRKNV